MTSVMGVSNSGVLFIHSFTGVILYGLPCRLSGVKNPPASTGDSSLIPGSGRSPGDGNGNALQYSCLENLMDKGPWWAIVHEVAKSQTRLNTHILMLPCRFRGQMGLFSSPS